MRAPITLSFLTLLTLSLGVPAIAATERGSGTRGGGQTVDIDGRPVLKDLVTNTVCRWRTGASVRDSLPQLTPILNRLASLHWYYRSTWAGAAARVTVCFTQGDLVHISTVDQDGLTIGEENGGQVAIRLNDEVYIDEKIFNRMDPENQAYLFFHEIMHSFIELNAPQRNNKLRSFVSSVRSLVSQGMRTDDFMLQMRQNAIEWPQIEVAAQLDPFQDKILLLQSDDPRQAELGAAVMRPLSAEFGRQGVLSKVDLAAIDEIYERARTLFGKAAIACDVAGLRRGMDTLTIRPLSESGGYTLTWEKVGFQVFDATIAKVDGKNVQVVSALLDRYFSNANQGLNNRDCFDALALVLSRPGLGYGGQLSLSDFNLDMDDMERLLPGFDFGFLKGKNMPVELEPLFRSQIVVLMERKRQAEEKEYYSDLGACASYDSCFHGVLKTISEAQENCLFRSQCSDDVRVTFRATWDYRSHPEKTLRYRYEELQPLAQYLIDRAYVGDDEKRLIKNGWVNKKTPVGEALNRKLSERN